VIFANQFVGDFTITILLQDYNAPAKEKKKTSSYPLKDQIRNLYIWANTYNGGPIILSVRDPSYIKLNRDYYLKPLKGYVPFTYPHPLTIETAPVPDPGEFVPPAPLATGTPAALSALVKRSALQAPLALHKAPAADSATTVQSTDEHGACGAGWGLALLPLFGIRRWSRRKPRKAIRE
jgi:hypothetical protein